MPLRLKITSYHARRLKAGQAKEFGINGGRIGRSLDSDWVLQDGNHYVSGHHASIDFRSGSYYIVDTSRNGVYVNDASTPIGRGNPQRLFDGDRLRIGEYEMVAIIDDDESINETLRHERHVDPVVHAQFVESPDPTGRDLVGEHEMTAVGIEDLLLEGASANALKAAALKAAAGMTLESDTAVHRRPSTEIAADSKSESSHTPAADRYDESSPAVAMYAFFRGAGLEPRDIDDEQAAMVLHGLGRMTRELAKGLVRALRQRAAVERKLRISAPDNQLDRASPLSASVEIDDIVGAFIAPSGPGSVDAAESVREAFMHLEIHQRAMLSAMHLAIMDLLERFDPGELELSFERQLKRHSFIGSSGKRRYWEMYAEAYGALARRAPGKLPEAFLSELSQAYEEEAARILSERHLDDSVQVRELVLPETRATGADR